MNMYPAMEKVFCGLNSQLHIYGVVIQPGSNFITENDWEDSMVISIKDFEGKLACSSSSDDDVILGLLYAISSDDNVVQENDIHY